MLEAMSNDELADMMEIVFKPKVAFLAFTFGVVLVEFLVDAFTNATVDQYGSRCLVCSYRTKIIQPDVHARHTFCFALGMCGLFVLNIHDKPETLGCQDDLFVGSGTLNAEAVVGGCNGVGLLLDLVLASLDGFVVEDDLSQFVFVVRWLRSLDELGWVFLIGVECLLEVRPVGQALTNSLLCCLRVVQVLEAIGVFDGGN